MTTNITIKTHDWPVQVVAVDRYPDGSIVHMPMQTIPPHTDDHGPYACWDTRSLLITELKAPEKETAGTPSPDV